MLLWILLEVGLGEVGEGLGGLAGRGEGREERAYGDGEPGWYADGAGGGIFGDGLVD